MSFIIGEKSSLPAAERPVEVASGKSLFVMAGPCVIETEKTCLDIAERLVKISDKLNTGIVFKASFDKANRSSIKSFRGPGLEDGLSVLKKVREQAGLPVMTDIHVPQQAAVAAEVVDCLQVPAFLCRQTDLLTAAAETGKPVNVKKGQFLSPEEMQNVVEKLQQAGCKKIMLTERGTFFGYNRLVNDMTAINKMQKLGCPVVFDVTHSTQLPGGLGYASAGQADMAPLLARAAVAAGADGLFIEVHTDPQDSKSDAATIMHIDSLEDMLKTCIEIFDVIRG